MPCEDAPSESAEDLILITEPPVPLGLITGSAPLRLTVSITGGILTFPAGLLGSRIEWGDGASTNIASVPCDNGEDYQWAAQSLSHTYERAGQYALIWHFVLEGQVFDAPFSVVLVEAGPTPTPEATATPAGTAAATGTAPAVATASATQPAPSPAGGTPQPTTASATPSPGATAGNTPSPSPSPPAATATATTSAESPASGQGARGGGGSPAQRSASEPRLISDLAGPDEISTDSGVISTNLAIAGLTVWVLFSTVFLNQVLQDNRAQLDRASARLTRPLKGLGGAGRRAMAAAGPAGARRAASVAAVLLVTAGIYSVLEPEFGANRATAVLFVSAVLGVGGVTYFCSGLESLAIRRVAGAEAHVTAFPAAVAIAIVSVAISRLFDLSPGVMYGFVASTAVAGQLELSQRDEGRVAMVPVLAGLLLTVGAWLALWPLRVGSWDGTARSIVEAALIVTFIGGVEGLFIGLVPVAATDGGKIFRWSRIAWLAVALVSAFLVYHVLIGRDREYFSGLREAGSLAVLLLFGVYSLGSLGLWLYFRRLRT